MIDEHLERWLKDNREAIAFIKTIFSISRVWDDLVDRDRPVPSEAINLAFYRALVSLPRNPFYAQNFALLSPLVELAIFNWQTANVLEASKANLETAYELRCSDQSLVVMSANIIGGPAWAQLVSNEIKQMGETFADYKSSLEAA